MIIQEYEGRPWGRVNREPTVDRCPELLATWRAAINRRFVRFAAVPAACTLLATVHPLGLAAGLAYGGYHLSAAAQRRREVARVRVVNEVTDHSAAVDETLRALGRAFTTLHVGVGLGMVGLTAVAAVNGYLPSVFAKVFTGVVGALAVILLKGAVEVADRTTEDELVRGRELR